VAISSNTLRDLVPELDMDADVAGPKKKAKVTMMEALEKMANDKDEKRKADREKSKQKKVNRQNEAPRPTSGRFLIRFGGLCPVPASPSSLQPLLAQGSNHTTEQKERQKRFEEDSRTEEERKAKAASEKRANEEASNNTTKDAVAVNGKSKVDDTEEAEGSAELQLQDVAGGPTSLAVQQEPEMTVDQLLSSLLRSGVISLASAARPPLPEECLAEDSSAHFGWQAIKDKEGKM
jgi:hypothetical protein